MSRPTLSILIVDGDLVIARQIGEALERDGHRTTLAPTTGAALARTHAHDHDVVLLDLNLSDSGGGEAVRVLREQVANAVIVGLACDPSNVTTQIEPLVDMSLIKPVDQDLLSGLLIFLYEKRRTRRWPR